ncbi:MAG: alpha/beta hydrolase [Gemmatimonadota bacterium]
MRLHYRTWEVDRARAGLLMVHGMFEHSRRYEELARSMASHHLSTFALDLRGHGESEGRRGHVHRFDVLLQDVDRFRREVQSLLAPDLPLFLLGHSLGGLIVLRYLEEYDAAVCGAIMTSPWLGTAVPVPRWQVLAAAVLDRILPAFPFPFSIDPADLTHDEERAQDYREDSLIHGTITPRFFTQTSAAIEQAHRRGDRIHVPTLFLLAGDDRIVDTERSLAFARSLPSEDITINVLRGQYHELLQERNRETVYETIHEWIRRHLP